MALRGQAIQQIQSAAQLPGAPPSTLRSQFIYPEFGLSDLTAALCLNKPWAMIERYAEQYQSGPSGIHIYVYEVGSLGEPFSTHAPYTQKEVSPLVIAALFTNSEDLDKLVDLFCSSNFKELELAIAQLNNMIECQRLYIKLNHDDSYTYPLSEMTVALYRLCFLENIKKDFLSALKGARTIPECLNYLDKISAHFDFEPQWVCGSFPFFCRGRRVYDKKTEALIIAAQLQVAILAKNASNADLALALNHNLFTSRHDQFGIPDRLRKGISDLFLSRDKEESIAENLISEMKSRTL